MSHPTRVESIHGRGVVHVGSFYRGSWPARTGYDTACGSFIQNAKYLGDIGPVTCTECLEALGLGEDDDGE